jgi:hypothetical protein
MMHLSQEKIEIGKHFINELELLINELDPKTANLNLEKTVDYMVYIRGKMFNHFVMSGDNEEIMKQIHTMTKCIDTVRKMIKEKNASPM